MPELLLELFSEEIPARMQAQAAKDLERLVVGALSDRGLLFEGARAFAGPRRLTLAIAGLPAKQPDVSEEKKGPRVGAPEKAIDGFLKSSGVTLDQCQKQSDAKGEFYVAVIARKGRATGEVLAELLPDAIAKLPWPKSMRWGQESKERGTARWVRPLHSIVATFDGEVVPFQFAGVSSGNITRGHRFMSDGKPIAVRRFDDYADKLRAAHVIVDAGERREIILHEAKQRAFALGLELAEDEGLLNEVTGLAEWPVVLTGGIDAAFMDLPPEILQTSMRAHQKYFALRAPDGKLANKFVVVANMAAEDGGKEIVAGNERVLRARLSDAKFFWDLDRKIRLENRVEALSEIVFHAKLGTQLERVQRIESLTREVMAALGGNDMDVEVANRAAILCKADLTTGVVGEFPELQGVMGRYYAIEDAEPAPVSDALRDYYRPLGPRDVPPNAPVATALALADKIDLIASFFWIDERPTGSGDPYALRRAALGIIRTILENNLRLSTHTLIHRQVCRTVTQLYYKAMESRVDSIRALKELGFPPDLVDEIEIRMTGSVIPSDPDELMIGTGVGEHWKFKTSVENTVTSLLDFLADRLKVALKEKGARHDLIDAVFSLGNEDDLVRLVARVEALQAFLKTDDGANLLAGYKRAANILRIEEKKDKKEYRGEPDSGALKEDEEKSLAGALAEAKAGAVKSLQAEDFAAAMSALAKLRGPVDRFFDKVTVNVDDKALRENRLKLLSQIVDTAHQVADFSKIEG